MRARAFITGVVATATALILFHLYAPKVAYWVFTRGDK